MGGPPGAGGRRRSLPRVPVYDNTQQHEQQWSTYSAGPTHVEANFDPPSSFPQGQPMDQFDQFFYKSTHIGQPLDSGLPPEVNIEVPSDSDSSRRPSKYTISNASSCHDISIDD